MSGPWKGPGDTGPCCYQIFIIIKNIVYYYDGNKSDHYESD